MRAVWRILALVAAISLTAVADDDTLSLRIQVKSLGGSPVDRASVIVRFVEGRSIVKLGKKIRTTWETRTNSEGLAKLPSLPQGKIMIQVIAKGYQTFGKEFEILEPEKTIEIKLNPPQPQYSVHQ